MLNLLARVFIKDRENYKDGEVRTRYGLLCSALGIALNIVLFAGKYIAGVLSGSVAIAADAVNNLSDAGSSLISLLGFRLASKKPDPDHPFGHGRIEYLSGLAVSVLIILMGVELFRTSVEKIISPEEVKASLVSVGILLASIAVKVYMWAYNRAIGRKINSAAMLATATDSLSDTVSTAIVLVSMLVSHFFHLNIDGWVGVLVAIFILRAGYLAAKETLSPLLGKAPEKELVESIESIVLACPQVCGIHDLIVHDYGPGRLIVSLHAEVDGSGDIYEIHDAIDNLERDLKEALSCLAVVHMDPVDLRDEVCAKAREAVAEMVKTLDDRITIHDFRMVPGTTHTNYIFDAVLPVGMIISDEEAKKMISDAVSQHFPGCFGVVNIDRSYI
ncbi:MAG: cation transporter [Oscillospiraceae bacterium]|nr:cation transporter [Oscillospiraceae bacterium]